MPGPDNLAADKRLKALFARDEPPARDPMFSTAVLERLMRRRLIEDLAGLVGATTVGGMVLGLLWPVLAPAITPLAQGLAPVAACLTLAAIVVTLAGGRPGDALGLEHD